MTKVRIMQNGNNEYKVQYRVFPFWIDVGSSHGWGDPIPFLFDTIEQAKEVAKAKMEAIEDCKRDSKWRKVWP